MMAKLFMLGIPVSKYIRNIQDWVNKTGMNKAGTWTTDLEIFATASYTYLGILGKGRDTLGWVFGKGHNLDMFL